MLKKIFFVIVFLMVMIAYSKDQTPLQIPFNVNEVIDKISRTKDRKQCTEYEKIPFIESSERSTEYGEFLADTSTIYVPASGYQNYPSVCFDGTNYLAVWEESGIWATRVNQNGIVLDRAGIIISTNGVNPSVAFDGTNYLVVWQHGYMGAGCGIYAVRVSQNGVVLDINSIMIVSDGRNPSIAFDGTNYLVVWEDLRSGANWDIYGARVSQVGVVLDSDGIAISTAVAHQSHPSIAFDDTNYLVVWEDERNTQTSIYGARVTRTGFVLDPNGIIISTAGYRPSVVFGDTSYMVVWYGPYIHSARLNRNGVVLDPNGILVSSAGSYRWGCAVAFDGLNFLVVWQDNRNYDYHIFGARVSQDGIVLDPNGIAISTTTNDKWEPSVVFGAINYLVVWKDYRNGPMYYCSDIYATRLSRTDTVLDPNGIAISTAANYQYLPSVAFDGTNYLVVWEDHRSGYYPDIYGIRVNQSGIILDSSGIAISTAVNGQYHPSVAFDGTNYLVVWQDERSGIPEIYGARVNRAGDVLEPNGIPISITSGYKLNPVVVFDGINYFVVWQDGRGNDYDIYGTRVNQSGIVLEPDGIAISTIFDTDEEVPSLVFDGTYYFVVWQDGRGDDCEIYGARVSQSGVVLDTNGILISSAESDLEFPSIAFDGTNYFVVWQQWDDIYGSRVNQAGVVLDTNGIEISIADCEQTRPSVIFDGTNYLVAWQDNRNGSSDIYGAKVNTSGIVIDSFTVSVQPGEQYSPALVRDANNQTLITYTGWTGTYQGKVYNTYRIWGKFYPFVGIKEDVQPFSTQSQLLKIYPNPASSLIRIRCPFTMKEIRVYDVMGKLIRLEEYKSSGSKELQVSLKGIKSGVYFLKVKTSNKDYTQKLIVK